MDTELSIFLSILLAQSNQIAKKYDKLIRILCLPKKHQPCHDFKNKAMLNNYIESIATTEDSEI